MEHEKVAEYWNQNAEAWTKLSRMGYDIYRDHLNTPAFFEILPDIKGLNGLDIGCGEGHNTRKTAQLGAKMSAIDISSEFIKYAEEAEQKEPLGIEYEEANAIALPFEDNTFDFAIANVSFMDMPEINKAIKEAYRILKPKGFFQFSICHPCFHTPKWEWLEDENGKSTALKCGDYFTELNGELEEWIFSTIPDELKNKYPKFKVPRFMMPLSKWLNLLIETGFTLEKFCEPKPDDKTVEKYPSLLKAQIISWFLIIRCRK